MFQFLVKKYVIGSLLDDQSRFWIVRWDMVGMQNCFSNRAMPAQHL